MAARAQAKLIPTPPHAEPPALRISRAHGDTAGLERLLLQLAENRAGSDARLSSALDELRALLSASSNGAAPAQPALQSNATQHIEALEERVADLARRVQNSEAAQDPSDEPPGHPDLDRQFQELNAALEASLNTPPAPVPPVINPSPSAAGLQEFQAIAGRLESIDHAVNATGASSARIDAIEAQLAELSDAIQALSPQIEQAAQRAASETVSQFEESRAAKDAVARLDAIRQDLQALTQRAGRMDERTLGTLETISGTLQHLAQRIAVAEDAAANEAAVDEAEKEENPPGDSRQVSEETQPGDSGQATQPGDSRQAPKEPQPGNSRRATKNPGDSRQAPKNPGDSRQAPRNPGDSRRATKNPGDSRQATNKEPEPVAVEPPTPAPRRVASDARKPGKILVIAAVALLILSAGLLYGRLNSRTGGPPGADHHLAPTAPAPAEPSADHEGSHAAQPGSGDGADDGNPEMPAGREKTQKPAPKLEMIPATRFDRASLIIADPRPFAPGFILKSQSH